MIILLEKRCPHGEDIIKKIDLLYGILCIKICINLRGECVLNMKDENMISAQHIICLRNKSNLKQDELAAIVSELMKKEKPYASTIVADWEAGKEKPSKEAALAMADLFNTSVAYILGKTDTIDRDDEKCEV